ncbi:GDSL-type esterase/lipase family protein [Danxiaibacter flavus]|uniref:GDSL-type esterase/lipase family protein n=1 Tax=Danxiaibacter flavus TaxID=3049108 RepID=A0ABV3ZK67_9BACT|nr:GDSL-type esterase/lipase family protein [Chitinophagaceae bacterium DXS]
MRLSKHLFLFFCLTLLFSGYVFSQRPFQADINAFKKQDSIQMPPANSILFVGSSSFAKWKDVQDYFPGYTIINRGFGGSSLPDVYGYANDIIFPYKAKQIVIYCGENDFTASDTVSVATVVDRTVKLFNLIRDKQPNVAILYVSMKPSPSRRLLMPKFEKANEVIKAYLSTQPNTGYADVYHPMLNENKEPRESLFTDDNLHMNAEGYGLWQTIIQPLLVR